MSCHFLLQGTSWPRDGTRLSCIAGGFFSTEPPSEPSVFDRNPQSRSHWMAEHKDHRNRKGENELQKLKHCSIY